MITANKCVLTIISSGIQYSLMAARMASLQDLLALRAAQQRVPSVRLTTGIAGGTQHPKLAIQAPIAESATVKEMSLLDRVVRIFGDNKDDYEQQIGLHNKMMPVGSPDGSIASKVELLLGLLTPGAQRATSANDVSMKTTTTSTSTAAINLVQPSTPVKRSSSEAPFASWSMNSRIAKTTAETTWTESIGNRILLRRRSQPLILTPNISDDSLAAQKTRSQFHLSTTDMSMDKIYYCS